ncbi:hypothetical protein ACFL1V_02320 [Pseudomonadota bacterium]
MDARKKDQQLAALLAAASIIGSALVYWVIQIQYVLETLALASG